MDQQLDLCQKADEALAEAAELADRGKFQQAKWLLEATDRDFDFSKAGEPDSTQTLIAEVYSMTEKRRHQVKSESKRVLDLIRADQLLEQSTRADDFPQLLAALEVANAVQDNTYLKQRAAKVIDQVDRLLQSGPALVTLKTRPDEEQTTPAGGNVA